MTGSATHVLPVILTCERDIGLTEHFVRSFGEVGEILKAPLVLVDQSQTTGLSAGYLSLLDQLAPSNVFFHPAEPGMSPYDSVQEAANLALACALRHSSDQDRILFLEDDVIFSSRFEETVAKTPLSDDTGFLTLYLPDYEYGAETLDPSRFYGTQCLLFTRRAVSEIVENRMEMMARFSPGYDIRWSRFLAHRGFILRCTARSYVQHLGTRSRLHGRTSHTSKTFVP